MLKGPYKDLPAALQSRAHYAHTPFHTHLRTTESEMYAAGKLIAEKHNLCRGKNAIIIPQGGYSMQNRVGHVLYDAQANAGFEKGVRIPQRRRSNVSRHRLISMIQPVSI